MFIDPNDPDDEFKYGILVIILLGLILLISLQKTANASEADIENACKRYNASDCNLIKAISWVESRYKNTHVMDNGSYSYGPLQVKCAAARDAGLKHSCNQLTNKTIALRFGILYFEQKLKQYKDPIKAIVSYNSYKPIICKKYNPGKCYRGEYINQEYLIKVIRHYNYLKREQLWKSLKLQPPMKIETQVKNLCYTNQCILSQETLQNFHKIMMN